MLGEINPKTCIKALAKLNIGSGGRARDGCATGGVNFTDRSPADEVGDIAGRYAGSRHDRYSGSGAGDQLGDAIATFQGARRAARRQYPLETKVYSGIQRHVELRRDVEGAM
jgi:hypothetical protein